MGDRTQWPRLRDEDFHDTSDDTIDYNCIAHAAGVNDDWWWPSPIPNVSYWPPGVTVARTRAAFAEAYGTIGYEICADGDHEDGYQKIAIYVDDRDQPTHAARELDGGHWTSKLGSDIDMEHYDLACLEGGIYGTVAMFMRRPVAP